MYIFTPYSYAIFVQIYAYFLRYMLILLCFFLSLGLEIGKFYFCKKEELINTLQSNKVKLFVSTDRDDVYNALHTGRSPRDA